MTLTSTIKSLLNDFPKLRDDDVALYIAVCVKLGFENETLFDLLYKVDYCSVSDLRRRLQQKFPSLRGYKYLNNSKKYDSFKYLRYTPNNLLITENDL